MFYITISNGLLKNGHRKKMGEAVWEFMWLIDRVTRIDEDGYGWVLGGKPINLKDLADDLEVHEVTISRNLSKLEEAEYITKLLTPYGMIIKVCKAKKTFNKSAKPQEQSFNKDVKPALTETLNLPNGNVKPNKTRQYDNINKTVSKDTTEGGNPDINSLVSLLKKENHGMLDGSDQENRRYAWLLLSKFGYKQDPDQANAAVAAVVQAATSDSFHSKNATNFKYLFYNAMRIVQSTKSKQPKVITI